MRLWIPFLLLWAGGAVFGEPPRGIELFGTFGAMRGGGDEGSEGSGAVYGGAATLPFTSRWAVDVQALTSPLSSRPDFRLRRVLLSPGLQYRRGNDRAYWFLAFGPGWQRDRTRGMYQVLDTTGGSRTVPIESTQSGVTLHWRTGAVFQPVRRLLVRGEFLWANRHVLPNLGVAVSLGIRLGR